MSISIHSLSEADLESTDEVIMAAYNIPHSRKETLRCYLALQPDGAIVAEYNGIIVGFGAAMDYGPFAYIGLMSVHPTMQNRGIGQVLLEHLLTWLDTRGCATALLDATSVGAPLYERSGFTVDDTTLVLRHTQRVPLPRHLPEGLSTLREEDVPALVAFDAACFGANRGAVLASYWANDPECVLVVRNANRQITGYLIAQPSTLGPWAARTVEDAERLLISALTLPLKSEPGVFVSAHNSDALKLLTHYGFSEQRVLSHMRRGNRVQRSRHTTLFGQASLGMG